MATENKPKQPPVWSKLRSLPRKQKLGALAAGGIVVVLIVVLSISSPTTTPSPPGAFTLSSNAGAPDTDGTFSLSWTAASGATSYTVYEHTSYITALTDMVTFLGTTTSLTTALAGKSAGVHYFVVRARSAAGTRLSNCIAVTSAWQTWTWMKGSNAKDYNGSYGTKGESSPTNTPGARNGAAIWPDAGGNLWFFGGYGYNASEGSGYLNDLWWFNATSYEWTWINGSEALNPLGSWGVKGVPDYANFPGPRNYCATWTDLSGDLWLFGGYGYDLNGDMGKLQDLWRFNTTSRLWTWVNGSNEYDAVASYGNLGVTAPTNNPGARLVSMTWVDAAGDLWLFGGEGVNETGNSGLLNDLWWFNVASFRWTWWSGSNWVNQNGHYGTPGVPDAANIPGGRSSSSSWVDSNGDLWLFGGVGYNESGSGGYLNDLWWINMSSLLWAWMGGSNWVNQNGQYGTPGVPDAANIPGGRNGIASWVDASGDRWLFGGYGYNESGSLGSLNDLWRLSRTDLKWTCIGGSNAINQNGHYGTPGEPDIGNEPGARTYSMSWTGAGGTMWLFGGNGYASSGTGGRLNDLWRYFP